MHKLLASFRRFWPFGFPLSGDEPTGISAWPGLPRRTAASSPPPSTVVHGGIPTRAKTAKSRTALEKASAIFDLVLEVDPKSWTAAWLAGKAAQGLGDARRAYGLFRRAFELQPDHLDVVREFTVACLEAERPHEAVHAAQCAIRLAESNAGLKANLALAYLCAGDCGRAFDAVTAALAQNPRDPISLTLRSRVLEVQRGERPLPNTPDDLQTPITESPDVAHDAPALAFEPHARST